MEPNQTDNSRPICIFDSGIGGLNMLGQCAATLPDYDFIYFADNYNVPYGNLSHERICELSMAIFKKINSYNPLAAVVACNTVTAECIAKLREEFAFPILGIQPAVKQAAKIGGRCLVLATKATVNSKSFADLVERFSDGNMTVVACPSLAAYIENNVFSLPDKLPEGLLPDVEADCVVLGCTHYIFVKNAIKDRYRCPVCDGILGTADHLKKIIGNFDHIAQNKQKIKFIGGDICKNSTIYNKFWGNVTKINNFK